MVSCHDMKLGEVYTCKDCGLELQVIKECEDAETPADDCECATACGFECCGTPLTLKES
jgi:hypothetical protein